MKPPTNLKGEARRFFVRHAPHCEQDGTLTDATLDSFILLCKTWAILDAIDTENDPKGLLSWNGTLKSFERYATQFKLFNKRPVEKKADIQDVLKQALGD
jgi:phage terminase small subunit